MDDRRKNYRAWDAQQSSHEPVSPREALPEDDLVFFLMDLIPQMDLTPFHQYYAQELRGQPPFDVTMMVILLVYAYSVGVCSSRKIAAACERNLAFRAIVANDPPDFRTLSDFRKIHLAAFRPLFLEVLRVAGEMGIVKLGNLVGARQLVRQDGGLGGPFYGAQPLQPTQTRTNWRAPTFFLDTMRQ